MATKPPLPSGHLLESEAARMILLSYTIPIGSWDIIAGAAAHINVKSSSEHAIALSKICKNLGDSYRPIYHLESLIIYLAELVHESATSP